MIDVLQSHRFRGGEDLEQTLLRYIRLYNGQLPQFVLKGHAPTDALKNWHLGNAKLFQKRPYKITRDGAPTGQSLGDLRPKKLHPSGDCKTSAPRWPGQPKTANPALIRTSIA